MNARIYILTFLCLLLTAGAFLTAQTEDGNDYATALQENFSPDGPGAAAIVIKDDKILYHGAVGMASVELGVEMRSDNVFRIGSITKQFTSAAILKLAEEGKLSLEDEITKFLPEYPTQGKTITVHHLLNHTSGIKSYTGLQKWDGEARKRDFTPQEMVDYFKDEPMDFAPGEEFRYNNSGYFLLGYIVEIASGKTYEEYVEETFFAPLGMEQSRYGNPLEIVPGRVEGYAPGEGGFSNAEYLSMTQPYGAGSLLSTVEDLSTWYHALVAGKVISEESLEKALTPTKLNNGETEAYGYGWSLGDLKGSRRFGHNGGINGFVSTSLFLPDEKVFVAVLSNCTCNDPSGAANKMAEIAIDKYEPIVAIDVKAEQLAAYVGKFE
ncbi:MAG: serine hydrolase domain-containing protein, partial [Bacteroidota bacterium]